MKEQNWLQTIQHDNCEINTTRGVRPNPAEVPRINLLLYHLCTGRRQCGSPPLKVVTLRSGGEGQSRPGRFTTAGAQRGAKKCPEREGSRISRTALRRRQPPPSWLTPDETPTNRESQQNRRPPTGRAPQRVVGNRRQKSSSRTYRQHR